MTCWRTRPRSWPTPPFGDRLNKIAQKRADALAKRHSSLIAKWAEGLTQVAPTSTDLVALTLLYPEVTR